MGQRGKGKSKKAKKAQTVRPLLTDTIYYHRTSLKFSNM